MSSAFNTADPDSCAVTPAGTVTRQVLLSITVFAADVPCLTSNFAPATENDQSEQTLVVIAGNNVAINSNGVTYNVYADPQGMDRPWEVDPLPLLLSAQEWQAIEEGVTQRAELLNRVLADIYGPQELLKSGGAFAELWEKAGE